jgi:DNA invertase Pin-like site-specific DNA recombinase
MKIGYARVSTIEQNLALQCDALNRAGCDVIYTDQGISGTDFERPGLTGALERLGPEDTLVVWRLDRLGRSLSKLVELVNDLGRKRIDFISLTESINTQSSSGVLLFHMMAALAEFERNLISERTRAGMAAARARGRHIGRAPALNADQRREALQLLESQSLEKVAKRFNVHPRTLQRRLADVNSSAEPVVQHTCA